jgi:DNA helicase-2/ATP-dependent DNA helicase PcrA
MPDFLRTPAGIAGLAGLKFSHRRRLPSDLGTPRQFTPSANIITLEQNYRSTEPGLGACTAVIGLATEGFDKQLLSDKPSEERLQFITAADEAAQVEYVVERVLEYREAGIDLKQKAVLFRAVHHTDQLEVELPRRNIPFVKYCGLKFLETTHASRMCSVYCAGSRTRGTRSLHFTVAQLLLGVSPASARDALANLSNSGWDFASLNALWSDAPRQAAGWGPIPCRISQPIISPDP